MRFTVRIDSTCENDKYASFLVRLQAFLKKECEGGTLETQCDLHTESDGNLISWEELVGKESRKC